MLNYLGSVALMGIASFSAIFLASTNVDQIQSISDSLSAREEIAPMKLFDRIRDYGANFWTAESPTKETTASGPSESEYQDFWSTVRGLYGDSDVGDPSRQKKETKQKSIAGGGEGSALTAIQNYLSTIFGPGDASSKPKISPIPPFQKSEKTKEKSLDSSLDSICSDADALFASSLTTLSAAADALLENLALLCSRVYENALLYFLLSFVTPIAAALFTINEERKKRRAEKGARLSRLRLADGILHDYFYEESRKNVAPAFWEAEAWRRRKDVEEEEEEKVEEAKEEVGEEEKEKCKMQNNDESITGEDDGREKRSTVAEDEEKGATVAPTNAGNRSDHGGGGAGRVVHRMYPQIKATPSPVLSTVFGRPGFVSATMETDGVVAATVATADASAAATAGNFDAESEVDGEKGEKEAMEKEEKVVRDEESPMTEAGIVEEAGNREGTKPGGKANMPQAAKDAAIVGPMGDSLDACFPEDMITLAVITTANCRKGGVETLV